MPVTVAFAILLALSESLHYYAIFAFTPFIAGEAVRWIRTRRFRAGIWVAFFVGGGPLVVFWSLLAGLKAYYGEHYFNTARLFRIPAYYDSIVDLGNGFGSGAAVVLGVAVELLEARHRPLALLAPRCPKIDHRRLGAG